MTIEEKAEQYSEMYFNRDETSMRISEISFIDGYELGLKYNEEALKETLKEALKEAYKKGYANGQIDAFM